MQAGELRFHVVFSFSNSNGYPFHTNLKYHVCLGGIKFSHESSGLVKLLFY